MTTADATNSDTNTRTQDGKLEKRPANSAPLANQVDWAKAGALLATTVDSSSILRNKAKLKSFWEARMELDLARRGGRDFESRRVAERSQEAFAASGKQISNGDEQVELVAKQLDENNNNDNNSGGNGDWHDCSPNDAGDEDSDAAAERPADRVATGAASGNCKSHTVSAELVCQKLRKYKADSEKRSVPTRGCSFASDEQRRQPMSLDPTLCHPLEGCGEPRPLESAADEEEEEQSASEEFSPSSSSSNCSFGPMSISTNVERGRRDFDEAPPQKGESSDCEDQLSEDGDEENNSTQSGSVQTVITKELDEDEEANNIGVAFESLQFDSEIKSSKEEKVDEERLIAPTAPPAHLQRFNSNEVRSVCNLITSAICDATQQVERFIKTGSGQPPAAQVGGCVRRATFVAQDAVEDCDGGGGGESAIDCELAHQNKSAADDDADEQDFRVAAGNHNYNCAENNSGGQLAARETTTCHSAPAAQKADLSSIFEANVRREIERFESNSVAAAAAVAPRRLPAGSGQQAGGGPAANKADGLTERRIAEEIRSFNEREMELKRRLGSARASAGRQQVAAAPTGRANVNLVAAAAANQFALVRFGAAAAPQQQLLPKSVNQVAASEQPNGGGGCRAIKLSTTSCGASRQAATTVISMHKFISSGGKRFVCQTSSCGGGGGSALLQHRQLAKSMSSLVAAPVAPRPADYKAADSLKCKETPNVQPGLAKRAIETFSRLQSPGELFGGPSETSRIGGGGHSTTQLHSSQQLQLSPSSADWKIQEELRDMRAREAELKSLRSKHLAAAAEKSQQAEQSAAGNAFSNFSDATARGDDETAELEAATSPQPHRRRAGRLNQRAKAAEEEAAAAAEGAANSSSSRINNGNNSARALSQEFGAETLHPIKQTIDSFRKLHSSHQSQMALASSRRAGGGGGGSCGGSGVQRTQPAPTNDLNGRQTSKNNNSVASNTSAQFARGPI